MNHLLRQRRWRWAMLLLVVLLSACTHLATSTTAPDQKDLVTASDESDASKRGRVRLELASAYFGRGQMTTALDQVKLAILADPSLGQAFNLRGLIYANLGERALAEESFRHALKLDAADADTMQNFGWYLCQQNRYAEANELFNRALAVPRYAYAARTLLTQGICQARAGQLEESETTLARSFELEPRNPSIAVNLAEVLYRRGEYQRARFYIRRVNAHAGRVERTDLVAGGANRAEDGQPPGCAGFRQPVAGSLPRLAGGRPVPAGCVR